MIMQKAWWAVLTAEVIYNRDINDSQKVLMAVISNLSQEKGYCFATNAYLSELLGRSERSVQRDLSKLRSLKLIGEVTKIDGKGDINFRAMTILSPHHDTFVVSTHDKSVTHNIKEEKKKENKPLTPKGESIDFKSILNDYNQMFSKNFRVVPTKAQRQIKARLKEGFTITEIFEALGNAKRNDFHIQCNFQYLTLEYITRSEQLDKWLNIGTQGTKVEQKVDITFKPFADE